MLFEEKSRSPNSLLVESVWYTSSDSGFSFLSYSEARTEIVFSMARGRIIGAFLRGPETAPSCAHFEPHVGYLGIQLRLGAFVPSFLPGNWGDRRDAVLPVLENGKVLFDGHWLEAPTYDNAEAFAEKLYRLGAIRVDEDVRAILDDQPSSRALRTRQSRFLMATGLSHAMATQIERAREAVDMLRGGDDIQDVIAVLGYFDQSHLYRNLRRFVGLPARGIIEAAWVGSLIRIDRGDSDG
mgnify:CR=1 FL=1